VVDNSGFSRGDCGGCGNPIRGEVLQALGKIFTYNSSFS